MVGVEPTLIDTLDGYARDLAEFDVDCAAQLGATATTNDKIIFLDSVGGYWEAKGENFGVSENDKTRLRDIELSGRDRIKSLCDAKTVYAQALKIPPQADGPSRGFDQLM